MIFPWNDPWMRHGKRLLIHEVTENHGRVVVSDDDLKFGNENGLDLTYY